jgi:hypothetical protein
MNIWNLSAFLITRFEMMTNCTMSLTKNVKAMSDFLFLNQGPNLVMLIGILWCLKVSMTLFEGNNDNIDYVGTHCSFYAQR